MNRKNDVIGLAGHGRIMLCAGVTWCNYCLPVAGRLLPYCLLLVAGPPGRGALSIILKIP